MQNSNLLQFKTLLRATPALKHFEASEIIGKLTVQIEGQVVVREQLMPAGVVRFVVGWSWFVLLDIVAM